MQLSPDVLSLLACGVLLVGLAVYIFYPVKGILAAPAKSHLAFLNERKDVVYENLRDLNFEHSAGKYPEEDYQAMRASLEQEAAGILSEIDKNEQPGA